MVSKDKISLGIIGYNDGNGHPYSFSAIVNGYDPALMQQSPYPNIAAYLAKRNASEFGVNNLVIDYIWTQDRGQSENISKCSHIPNIVDNYLSMITNVDGVIIARDDAESHREIATPFLEAGKFVFIDKPLCKTSDDLDFFTPYLKNGQLMSCSGFRYYPDYLNHEFVADKSDKIVFATAITTVDWYKYGIHMLEALQPLMRSPIVSVHNIGEDSNDVVTVRYKNGKYSLIVRDNNLKSFSANFFTADKQNFEINFNDNFTYFRNMLFDFHKFIIQGKSSYSYLETVNLISALIASDKSKVEKKIIYI